MATLTGRAATGLWLVVVAFTVSPPSEVVGRGG